MALVPFGVLLYPVVGALAVGTGLAIPALTALVSRRVSGHDQGRLMGGLQAILSLTLIVGPVIAGLAFDHLGVPAPYWIGSLLASLALLAAVAALLSKHRTVSSAKGLPREAPSGSNTSAERREKGA